MRRFHSRLIPLSGIGPAPNSPPLHQVSPVRPLFRSTPPIIVSNGFCKNGGVGGVERERERRLERPNTLGDRIDTFSFKKARKARCSTHSHDEECQVLISSHSPFSSSPHIILLLLLLPRMEACNVLSSPPPPPSFLPVQM